MKSARNNRTMKMGPSHHFFRTLMKAHNSPKIESLPESRFNALPVRFFFLEVLTNSFLRVVLVHFKFFFENLFPIRSQIPLVDNEASHDEAIHLGPHEASPCILRCAYDRFTAHVE